MTLKWKAFCPECRSENDEYTGVDDPDAVPEDGDVSICAYCGTVSKFAIADDVVRLRKLEVKEHAAVMSDPLVLRTLRVMKAVKGS